MKIIKYSTSFFFQSSETKGATINIQTPRRKCSDGVQFHSSPNFFHLDNTV